jgi:hypothetical protein
MVSKYDKEQIEKIYKAITLLPGELILSIIENLSEENLISLHKRVPKRMVLSKIIREELRLWEAR